MNLDQWFYESLKNEEFLLAYSIFWAKQKGLVTGSQSYEDFQKVELDFDEIAELQKTNPLNMKQIKLWSLRADEHHYAFIFAESEASARGFFLTEFKALPISTTDATTRLDHEMWNEDEGYWTFRELRSRTLKFPSLATVYSSYRKSDEEVEQEYMKKFGVTLRRLE